VVFDISLLLLLVPSVGMVFTLSRREIALGEERMVAQLRTEIRHRAGALESWIEHQIQDLDRVSALGREFHMTPSPRLQEELHAIHRLAPGFRNLYLADASGRSVGFDPPLNALGKSNIGLDFSDHDYVKAMKARLKPVVSGVFVGRRVLFEPIFTISAPLVEEGRFTGFGAGAVSMEHLQSLLTQAQGADPPYLTLLDIHDTVVTTTDPGLRPLAPRSEPPGARIQPIEEGVFLRVPAVRRNISVMETWKGARYFTKVPIRGSDWTLQAELPAGPLQERAFDLAIWSLMALGGLFLLVLAVSAIVARALSGATVRLAAFSEDLPSRIESGEHLAWPDSRFQEISQLTAHFRTTSVALGERINQLKTETERRVEIERALIHQSRLAAMGEMIGHIAHQWRQPLNSLSMLLANLRERFQQHDLDPESLEQAFAKGDLLIGKMSSTVSDFGNFFSPDKAMTVFSALQQVQAALGLMEASLRAGDVSVTVEAAADVQLFGFPNEYSQVLLNLLANARQAMDESGASTRRVMIRLTETDGYGALSVADSGGGIPEDILNRIFEPYFSTRASGTGIGLYMCRQIVEGNMGGRISVRNVEGGAEFTVLVPLVREGR
jgi:signal transduction histidine kinase